METKKACVCQTCGTVIGSDVVGLVFEGPVECKKDQSVYLSRPDWDCEAPSVLLPAGHVVRYRHNGVWYSAKVIKAQVVQIFTAKNSEASPPR